MRLGLVRTEFYLRIANILLAGLGFLALLFGVSLTGNVMPVEGVVGATLLVAFVTHLLLRASFTKFDPKNWERKAKLDRAGEIARTIGGVSTYFAIAKSIFGFLLLLAFFSFFFHVFVLSGGKPVMVTSSFYVILGSIAGYVLFLRPLVIKLGSLVVTKNAAYMPSYSVVPDGVVLDLNIIFVGKKPAHTPDGKIKIAFDELDEVKALELHEAQQYMQYEIGPDVKRAWQELSGEVKYMMGKVPRPRAYFKIQSGGKTLVLRGPEVLYVLTVNTRDCTDLVQAFEKFKAK